jgi:hypothetical protein
LVFGVTESEWTLVAGVLPKSTSLTPVRLDPVIVTVLPPAPAPDVGLMAESMGV